MAHPTLTTRVLLYRDEGEWIAHSLELDLVGTGENEEEAKKELVGAIVTQVEFCHEKGWDPFFPHLKKGAGQIIRRCRLNSIFSRFSGSIGHDDRERNR